jgi:hypothetical protein
MSKRKPRATLTQRHPADIQVACMTCGLALWQRFSEPRQERWGQLFTDCPFEAPCPYRVRPASD